MFKTRFISMLVLLMTAVSGAWADTTVTWEGTKLQSIAVSKGYNTNVTTESMTVDGITITANNGFLKNGSEGVTFNSGAADGVVFSAENNIKSITITSTDFSQFTDVDIQFGGGSHTYEVSPAATSYGFANSVSIMGITKIEITLEGAPTVAVTGVTLAPTSATLTLGETETVTLIPTVLPAEATDKSVTWSSSNEAVATVTDGVVTAVAAGTATITVTATNGTVDTSDDFSATCEVTVSNPTVTANEGATGEYWATYYNGTTSFTADENTTVFQAALSGSSLTLTVVPNREIPATKAVILKSSSATITLTPATTTATLEGNQLVGTATAITNPGNAYVLNKGTNGVGFYKLSSTGTIGANKAYLTYSSPSQARSFFGFDETTGIEMPTAEVIDADAVVYDLQGRRVAQPTKGLYIVNGKKVIK